MWIVYPRNFGTSDHTSEFNWQEMAGNLLFKIQMIPQDSCMNIKFPWPLSEVTVWEAKSPSPLPAITWTSQLVISVSIQPPWTNITSKQQDKSVDMSSQSRILTSQEASNLLLEISSTKFNALNGEAWFKAILLRETLHTDGISMLKPSLTIFCLAHQTHCGNGQPPTVFLQERLCSPSQNTQDGST